MANSYSRGDSKSDVKVKANGGASGNMGGSNAKESPPIPKDGQVVVTIMKDMGITEYEPKVINQLLEFFYHYVANVLGDSKVLCTHAGKKSIDMDDIKLAVQMHSDQSMTTATSREMLLEQARVKNQQPLPVPRPTYGLRLPPDHHSFMACNYRLKYKPKGPSYVSKVVSAPGYKQSAKANSAKVNSSYPIKANPAGMDVRVKPMFKINTNPYPGEEMVIPKIQIQPQAGGGLGGAATPQFKIQINPQGLTAPTMKWKVDEMDVCVK